MVRIIQRWLVTPHKGPVKQQAFPWNDIVMQNRLTLTIGYVTLAAIIRATMLVSYLQVKSLQLIWRSCARNFIYGCTIFKWVAETRLVMAVGRLHPYSLAHICQNLYWWWRHSYNGFLGGFHNFSSLKISHQSTHGLLARNVKLQVAYAPGMTGMFSPRPPRMSDPHMHHGKCVTHVS